MLKPLYIIFFILLPLGLQGQDEAKVNPELLNRRWNSYWISYPNASITDYGIFHFRKTFNLKEKPEEFVINISADNRYKLFVNGIEVCNGPARGDLANWRFETIDIANYLKAGKNILAAVVWNFGLTRPYSQITYKTAFIVQGNSTSEEVVNTGPHWKVYKNEAYKPLIHQPISTSVGPGEEVDASCYPYGWELVNYNDSLWKDPLLFRKATPYGKWEGWNWNLVPRNIPFMEHSFQRITEVERSENIEVENSFVEGKSPLKIPGNSKVKILLDQTFLTTAYFELVVSKGKGSSIEISYAEAMVDENGVKGNRNETRGKKIMSYYSDIFRPDGGENRQFKTLWFRTYRYLELTVETKDEPLIIEDLYGYFRAYPFTEKAYFKSSDPSLQAIWDVGWRTARLCAGETYYDCPYYEQLQYLGDTRIQALISLYVAGDDRLMRNAIQQYNNSLLPIGLTQSRYPSYRPQVIPPFSLIWIYMIHDFWMHRDDKDFVENQMNGVKNVLYWYENHIATNGMLGPMDYLNFVDWSFGLWDPVDPTGGTPSGAIDGNSSIITLQYVYALQQAAVLFEASNDSHQAAKYRQLAQSLMISTDSLCWSEERGLLADSPDKEAFSQHANIMAILTGLYDQKKSSKLFDKLTTEKGLTPATFYFQFYLTRAMVKVRKADNYIDMLAPWKDMIDIGLSTFAETPEPNRSDCHAWSAHPNYDLLTTVCGITPASPAFKSVNIEPHLGNLDFIECKMPHPKGDIILNLKRNGKEGIKGDIILPEGLPGKFIWNGKETKLYKGKNYIKL